MMVLSGYEFSTLREGEFTVYRGRGDRLPPILVVTALAEHPSPAALRRLEHEYALRDELDPSWAARPLALTHHNNRPALVLEDPGGEPLDRLLSHPLDTAQFLRIGISLAAAVRHLHQRDLIHKDIKPAHILADMANGAAWLTGLGIASRLPRERQIPEPPGMIAGTLAYMAPEQTGRMNRSIDSRSDLYALGVTLYEMATGELPFTANDPMAWIHCHIARQPVPPSERLPTVSPQISSIIMKLLAKTAEDRYQTAAGVLADLQRCLTDWEAQLRIEPFPLGANDGSDRLMIPERLYGRQAEIGTLRAAFDRVVAGGRSELVLVSGYSGIGKSSLVNELHKVLVSQRGLFAAGKFDQYKRNIPYATFAQACRGLVHRILGMRDAEMTHWRASLLEALGPNGQLMVNLIAELALIIGDQPAAPELPLQDHQARFQLVFRRFLGVFARPEHPLALFIDDLQWLDSATLELIEHLVLHPEVRHLLLIGAYRDNEVGPGHPLARTLARLRHAGARVREIVLTPLEPEGVEQLLADALHAERGRVRPLADLVFNRTAGNPFFTNQFLSALAEEALLTFDPEKAAWDWNLPRIRAKGFTDNVADLMATKLNRLPPATQRVLGRMACLGSVADTATLALVQETSDEAIHAELWEAIRAGLVLRTDGTYAFLHDRVQEAAYALIAEDERAMAHLRIGRLLAERTTAEQLDENIFDIVNQFDRGAALINTAREREQVARFNLTAGKRAKAATAFAAALRYFATGRALLSEENGGEPGDALVFDLELNRGECEYLTGELAAAEERLSLLSTRAPTTIDAAAVACVRINLYTTLDRSDRAVEVALSYLRTVGGRWPQHATAEDVSQEYERLRQRLGSSSIEGLLDLPLMIDPGRRATMDVLTVLTSPALFTDLNLFRLLVGRMATLSLEHGNTDGSSLAYAWLGGIFGAHFSDYQAGLRFGRLGLDLVEKRGLDRFRARVYLVFAVHVAHWTQPLATSRAFLRRAFEAAQEAGDLSYAAYSCIDVTANLLASGDPLEEVEREAETGLEFAQNAQFGLATANLTGQFRLIRMLRGLTAEFGSFDDPTYDDSRFVRDLENKPQLAISACWHWIRKLHAGVLAGDSGLAIAAATKAAPLMWTAPTQIEQSEYQFYGALARAKACDEASTEERSRHMAALADHYRLIAVWAKNCPATFGNRAALVGAEIARLQGRELDAEGLYEQAISLARDSGFVQNEGLANELAARFHTARGLKTIAQAYLRNARHCYFRWGAVGKVRQLDETFPQLREEQQPRGATSTIGTPIEHLDLVTVINVSQALSSEIVLGKLLDTLMRTAIEQAGAERGLLMLPRGADLRIAAEARTDGEDVVVQLRDEAVTAGILPESFLYYVLHTQELVILDDASAHNQFSADQYIRRHNARSILCLPLLNRGKLIGVLYLENNLTPHVFTSARLSVLKLLASQAAISLENARLYRDLEEREAKIRRLVEANIIGIFFADLEGRIFEANDAFLRILGYDRQDVVSGRVRCTDLTPPEWREREMQVLAELSTTGIAHPFEKEYFRKDGSRVPVLVGAAIFEKGGDRGVAFVLDLTERKRAEEALRQLESDFAHVHRVSMMGELAASLSHEIKQPIGATSNNALAALNFLERQPPDLGEVREALDAIVGNARRAADIVDRIRDHIKKAPPRKDHFDLNAAINEVIALARSAIIRNGVSIQTRFADELLTVQGDRIQLQQVVLNLILNAVEAMSSVEARPRELSISSEKSRTTGVLVAVRDSGPGIAPADLGRVFDAFYTTKSSGVGIGLSICRSIIEAHGGRLWAEANDPGGAVFQFTLPWAQRELGT